MIERTLFQILVKKSEEQNFEFVKSYALSRCMNERKKSYRYKYKNTKMIKWGKIEKSEARRKVHTEVVCPGRATSFEPGISETRGKRET